MPVDKFGNEIKQRGTAVKSDEGISLSFANKTYIRLDGESDITGNLNMALRKIENLGDPTNPKDATSKEYVDNTKGSGVIGEIRDETATIKGNLDFTGQYRIKNLPVPVDEKDAVSKEYVNSRDESLKTELLVKDAFEFKDNEYQAKQDLYLKGFKIHGTGTPFQDGDVVTKGYVESVSAPLLKLDEGKYKTKGDIDMSDTYTICNIRAPVYGKYITDKKYVDESVNFNSAFNKRNGGYEAKGNLYMRRNKILGLRESIQDGEASTKKYVDDVTANLFIDENDNITFRRDVDMENKKIFSLPEPKQDNEPATKKYVDDLQTQHVDEKGNVKFGRNVNLDNKRIFSMKEPKKDNEGANKKYVDDTITKRIQEEKDNFLPQDPATKQYVDEAIKGIAGGDVLVSKEGVFIKENGHYRATAPLDIDNQKMENLPDPVDEKDAVNKEYVDGIIRELTLKQGLVRENGGFNLVDSYINMNFNPVRNVAYPHHSEDAVPRSFLDGKIKTTLEQVQNQFKQLNQLVSVSASCHEHLKYGDYPFTFGGPIINRRIHNLDRFNGFLVPADGVLKHVSIYSMGLVLNVPFNTLSSDFLTETGPNSIYKLYGNKDNPIKIFSLVKVENFGMNDKNEIIGSVFSNISDETIKKILENEKYRYMGSSNFEFKPNQKYLNEEKNFICPVIQGDINNIISEYTETIIPESESYIDENGFLKALPFPFFKLSPSFHNKFFLHLATLTFLFKEMSFPDISYLDPLEEDEKDEDDEEDN